MNDKPKYNPNIHHRRSIRLKGYDYSQAGLYFVTICCQDRACLFGEIAVRGSLLDAQMVLNEAGKMIENEWTKLHERFTNIELHEYIVMPIHFHAVLEIVGATLVVAQNENENENEKGQPQGITPTKTIGDIINAFKSITTVEYIRGVKKLGWQPFNGKIWQRNYHEHIIRDEQSYQTISNYIINNPTKWAADKFYNK